MPNFLEGLPKEKVQLLYILGTAKAELTEQQFYQCARQSGADGAAVLSVRL